MKKINKIHQLLSYIKPHKGEFILGLIFLFLSSIRDKVKLLNSSSIDSFFVFQKRLKKELLRLELKIIKSKKIKNKELVNKCIFLHNEIFPNNVPQERINSFIPYYMKYGQDFFELLIEESSIFDNKYIILTEGP